MFRPVEFLGCPNEGARAKCPSILLNRVLTLPSLGRPTHYSWRLRTDSVSILRRPLAMLRLERMAIRWALAATAAAPTAAPARAVGAASARYRRRACPEVDQGRVQLGHRAFSTRGSIARRKDDDAARKSDGELSSQSSSDPPQLRQSEFSPGSEAGGTDLEPQAAQGKEHTDVTDSVDPSGSTLDAQPQEQPASRATEDGKELPQAGQGSSSDDSPLDRLFSSPDDFAREEKNTTNARRDAGLFRQRSQAVPRSVLGGIFRDSPTSAQEDGSKDGARDSEMELNREWGEDDISTSRTYDNGQPMSETYKRRVPSYGRSGSQMTPSEQHQFREIFQKITSSDSPLQRTQFGGDTRPDDNLFGSSIGGPSPSLRAFYERTVSNRERHRDRQRQLARTRSRRSHALLSEGPATESNISTEDLEEGIDRAREQVAACQSVQEVWEWARKNVWPSTPRKQGSASVSSAVADTSPAADAASASKDNPADVDQAPTPPVIETNRNEEYSAAEFGVMTPFYAPVLHILHQSLRERFHAPHSALAVLRIARSLGPESFVLGCTPGLYEAAIRTSWTVLHDLDGVYNLVLEARETGVLSGNYSEAAEKASRVARQRDSEQSTSDAREADTEQRSEVRIADFLDVIKQEVQHEVAEAARVSSARASSTNDVARAGKEQHVMRERRLFLVDEMTRLAPSPRFRSLSSSGDRSSTFPSLRTRNASSTQRRRGRAAGGSGSGSGKDNWPRRSFGAATDGKPGPLRSGDDGSTSAPRF